MEILRQAAAGTMESSDVYIEIGPGQGKREIFLDSVVLAQYGEEITRVIGEVLDDFDIGSVDLRVYDRGALECVLRARLETVILRGKGNA